MTAPDLAGRLQLFPGAAPDRPVLCSTRPDLVPTLLRRRPASQAPDLLGAVFTLCAHAHRWTARHAIEAAQNRPVQPTRPALQAHRLATLREHLLRISHDWPRLLPGAPAAPDAALVLRTCPVWRHDLATEDQLAALPAWLVQQWLGGSDLTEPEASLRRWLASFEADPVAWPCQWSAQAKTPLARLLQSQQAQVRDLVAPGPTLSHALQPDTDLPQLVRSLVEQAGFSHRPNWAGSVPDTGPWARRRDPWQQAGGSVWQRLVARVVETLRLAAPGGDHWLDHGSLRLGAGEGLAWCEMARGLLLHWVRLDAPSGGQEARVADWRVLAPTEWNFHPEGVLAQALRRLPSDDPETPGQAARLAVAFDPCVAFDVCLSKPAMENSFDA